MKNKIDFKIYSESVKYVQFSWWWRGRSRCRTVCTRLRSTGAPSQGGGEAGWGRHLGGRQSSPASEYCGLRSRDAAQWRGRRGQPQAENSPGLQTCRLWRTRPGRSRRRWSSWWSENGSQEQTHLRQRRDTSWRRIQSSCPASSGDSRPSSPPWPHRCGPSRGGWCSSWTSSRPAPAWRCPTAEERLHKCLNISIAFHCKNFPWWNLKSRSETI